MNYDDLINKYLQGQTSLEEESRIAEFLEQDDIDPKYASIKQMFSFFDSERMVQCLNPKFDEQMDNLISEQIKTKKMGRFWNVGKTISAIAACLTLFFVIGQNQSDQHDSDISMHKSVDVFKADPDEITKKQEEMYVESMEILLDVSQKLNKGLQHLESISKMGSVMDQISKIQISDLPNIRKDLIEQNDVQ